MIMSTSARSSIFVVGLRRPRAVAASSLDILCFETSFSSSLSGLPSRNNLCWNGQRGNPYPRTLDPYQSMPVSCRQALRAHLLFVRRRVQYRVPGTDQGPVEMAIDSQHTICPAPTTPSFLTSVAASRLTLALNIRLPIDGFGCRARKHRFMRNSILGTCRFRRNCLRLSSAANRPALGRLFGRPIMLYRGSRDEVIASLPQKWTAG